MKEKKQTPDLSHPETSKPSRLRQFGLAAALLAASGVFAVFNYVKHQTPARFLEISVDGQVIETLDLSRQTEYVISGVGGGTNRLVVEDGKAWVSEASCPDKVCMQQGSISQTGQLIVCLPNRVVITVTGEESPSPAP